jgi:hypothetical protein
VINVVFIMLLRFIKLASLGCGSSIPPLSSFHVTCAIISFEHQPSRATRNAGGGSSLHTRIKRYTNYILAM